MHKEMPVVSFGLNLDKYSGPKWKEKVEEFRLAVEEHGSARASWSCEGRTRHLSNACMLAEDLPQFEFDIDYDSYRCIASKKEGQENE